MPLATAGVAGVTVPVVVVSYKTQVLVLVDTHEMEVGAQLWMECDGVREVMAGAVGASDTLLPLLPPPPPPPPHEARPRSANSATQKITR